MRKFMVMTLIVGGLISTSTAYAETNNSDQKMVLIKTIGGTISPKSVLASDHGLISAHNMMYNHSVTIYDANKAELIATVPDTVVLSDFGYAKYSGNYRGAPVEGAYSPDGKYRFQGGQR